jgi:hypothetical protein
VALQLVPSEHRDLWRIHRVGPGEMLASIGKLYGIAAGGIVAANGLHSAEASEGDRLLIPAVPHPVAPVLRTAARASARKTTARASTKTPASKGSKTRVAASPAHKQPVVLARRAS